MIFYLKKTNLNSGNHNFKMMDFVEDYPRSWAKREEVELDTMSEWVKLIRSLILSQLCKIWKNTTIK